MPLKHNYIMLLKIITPNKVDKKDKIVAKFKSENNQSLLFQRLAICYNLASVLEEIHKQGKYVIIDLKPNNIMINFESKIVLIDIDSIQVSDNTKTYYADATSPQYTPPEFHNKNIKPLIMKVEASWDYFLFAMICYQLIFEMPAYSGTVEGYNQEIDLLKKQYFPFGQHAYMFSVKPQTSLPYDFNVLSKSLREVFIGTFDGGISDRITFNQWKNLFYEEWQITKNTVIPSQNQTIHQNSTTQNNTPQSSQNPTVPQKQTNIFFYFLIGIILIILANVVFQKDKKITYQESTNTNNIPTYQNQDAIYQESTNSNSQNKDAQEFDTEDDDEDFIVEKPINILELKK